MCWPVIIAYLDIMYTSVLALMNMVRRLPTKLRMRIKHQLNYVTIMSNVLRYICTYVHFNDIHRYFYVPSLYCRYSLEQNIYI